MQYLQKHLQTSNFDEEPRLLNVTQGSLILHTVQYKGRFLYSKYDPQRSIKSLVEKTKLLEGTIVLVMSPCLWYGLEDLLKKLPSNSIIVAFEKDEKLFTLSQKTLCDMSKNFSLQGQLPLYLLKSNEINSFLEKNISSGIFKRAIRLDFSAGIQFNLDYYSEITKVFQDYIAQFWKNRITLVKLGRLYSRNIFKNLCMIPLSSTLEENKKTIGKTIIVCGAGESLDNFIKQIKNSTFRNKLYILAVDAALPCFLSNNIFPDAVVSLECQKAIEKAFYCAKDSKITLFCDISSRPQIRDILNSKTVYFSTKYASSTFLEKLEEEKIIPSCMPPMGSVGLAALELALELRQNEDIKIFISGLDFSFSLGRTHATFSPAHRERLNQCNRLKTVENYDAAFKEGAFSFAKNNGKVLFTDKALFSYAEQFIDRFSKTKNLFYCTKSGIDLKLPQLNISEETINKNSADTRQTKKYIDKAELNSNTLNQKLCIKIKQFYETEKNTLKAIKDLLSKGNASIYRNTDLSLDQQLYSLIKPRDYLYLHFADGYRFSMDTSFLKRVKAEADFFLKDIQFALKRNPL